MQYEDDPSVPPVQKKRNASVYLREVGLRHTPQVTRALAGTLAVAEDVVYAITAILLFAGALFMLGSAGAGLLSAVAAGQAGTQSVLVALDQVLVVLIFVEVFYTVRLSLLEHALAVEPFIAVALIAGVRRLLVLIAQEHYIAPGDQEAFQRLMIEMGLLGVIVILLVAAIVLLRRARVAS